MFGAVLAADDTPAGVVADIAREFSPRIEVWSHAEVVLDLIGLTRLFGDARTIAEELRRTAADRGVRVRVAIAGTRTAARLLARHRAGLTIVEPGTEPVALASLPIALLEDLSATVDDSSCRTGAPRTSNARIRSLDVARDALRESKGRSASPESRIPDLLTTVRRWGLRTLGDLAALPADDVAARLGRPGVALQRLSRGEDPRPLVPAVPEERFEQSLDLEWPIAELEPLSFVLGRLMEPLAAHLEQRDRGAAVLHVRLHLIQKSDGATRDVHERSLQLPFPIRDARTLRTLAMLDLESHPPAAAIDRVMVAVDPTPARVVPFSLLTRPLPSPEQISTLMARLHALMGDTRCGSPATVDSWEPGAFTMKSFAPSESTKVHGHEPRRCEDASASPRSVGGEDASMLAFVALRRFRHPLPVRVHVREGRPSSVTAMQRGVIGGGIESCAGPWRTSGKWWESRIGNRGSGIGKTGTLDSFIPDPRVPIPAWTEWDRDEWDVSLTAGPAYRLFRERHTDRWFLEGVVD